MKNIKEFISRNKLPIICILIFAIMISGLAYFIISYSNDKPEVSSEILESKNNDVVEEDPDISLQDYVVALHEKYDEAVAWIKVPGTNINGAVFQSSDNSKYLKTDRDGNKTDWGEYFMDYRCDLTKAESMSHYIIYGHNTEKDDNFSQLLKYKDESYYKENNIIELSTLKGNYKWQIFSVYITNTDFFYIDVKFADAAEYKTFLDSLKVRSMYDTGVEVTSDDAILTLSTCEYSIDDGRFVVQAKLIK